jgi:hypothetical protein
MIELLYLFLDKTIQIKSYNPKYFIWYFIFITMHFATKYINHIGLLYKNIKT